jgi:hypothetical protein
MLNRRSMLKAAAAGIAAACGLWKREVSSTEPRVIGIVTDSSYHYDPNCYEMLVKTPGPMTAVEVRATQGIPKFGQRNDGKWLRLIDLRMVPEDDLLWRVRVEYGELT